jgi:hypothetical protein
MNPREMQSRSAASRWSGVSKEERSEAMRRIRKSRTISSTNDAVEEVRRLQSLIRRARAELGNNEPLVAEILDAALVRRFAGA